jgi:plasmid stability protein
MKYDYQTTDETRLILQLVDCDDATRRALKRQAKRHHASVEAYMSVLVLNWLESDEESAAREEGLM